MIIEFHMCCIVCPECWCTIKEFGEFWAIKVDCIQGYAHVVELRGIDAGHVTRSPKFGNTVETKFAEIGEDSAF